MERETKIKRLILEFPHGASVKACELVAQYAQQWIRAGVSEGGYLPTYIPMTAEKEKHRGPEFSDDTMQYVYGWDRRCARRTPERDSGKKG